MKHVILLFAFVIVAKHVAAQIQNARASEINAIKTQVSGIRALTDFSSHAGTAKLLDALQIQGKPYLKEENSMGTFYLGDSIIKIPTRLNYYANGFEFEADGKTYVTTSNTIDSVLVDNATYVFRVFKLKGESLPRVLKVVDRHGRNLLYVYQPVEFVQEQKPGPLVDYKPARFEWNDQVYLFELGSKLIILNNFKELMSMFPGKEKDIRKFIKENNINKDNPDELRKLLGYMSQLSEQRL
jgi:hypothetical protein